MDSFDHSIVTNFNNYYFNSKSKGIILELIIDLTTRKKLCVYLTLLRTMD
jgi:hypothetical protein